MAKIVGFDGWTVGSHHYQRLVSAFERNGFDLTLLHLGSWGNEKGRPREETIGPLHVRDVAFYRGKNLRQILQAEKPDAVLLLSTDAFAHRALIRYCRQMHVPTIHLFHGLQQLMDHAPLKSSALKRLWLLRGHVLKLLRYFWPSYVRALWETRAGLSDWWRFFTDIAGRAVAFRPRHAAEDSKTDRACVYIESEVEYAVGKYGYERAQIIAVGNPDLFSFGLPDAAVGSALREPALDAATVVYIDTALLDYGSVFNSKEDFVQHIIATNRELGKQGRRLVFKPHPSTGADITDPLRASGIEVCANKAFIATLQRSCACITEPSSAALIPSLMGMPVLLARYGSLAGQAFGELISSYPRARYLDDIEHFNSILQAERQQLDLQRTQRWIAANTGPLPASEMPQRVADVVRSLVTTQGRR